MDKTEIEKMLESEDPEGTLEILLDVHNFSLGAKGPENNFAYYFVPKDLGEDNRARLSALFGTMLDRQVEKTERGVPDKYMLYNLLSVLETHSSETLRPQLLKLRAQREGLEKTVGDDVYREVLLAIANLQNPEDESFWVELLREEGKYIGEAVCGLRNCGPSIACKYLPLIREIQEKYKGEEGDFPHYVMFLVDCFPKTDMEKTAREVLPDWDTTNKKIYDLIIYYSKGK